MGPATRVFTQLRDAIAHLNPKEVREDAERPFTIQLFAPSPETYRAVESWFAPAESMTARADRSSRPAGRRLFQWNGDPCRA
jgi:hypothetical protein